MRRFLIVYICLLVACAFAQKMQAQSVADIAKSDSCLIEAQMAYNLRLAEQTKEFCNKAISFNQNNDAAYYLLAKVALVEDNLKEAENNLLRAVSIDSANYYYLSTLGAVYIETKDILAAIKTFNKITELFPTRKEAYLNLVNLYIPRGQTDKALEVADRLEKKIGVNEVSTITRFRTYSMLRDSQSAIKALKEADSVMPNPTYKSYLGELYYDLGKDSLALESFSNALIEDPDYAPALYGKMQIYGKNKNYALYLSYLKTFLGKNSENFSLKKSLIEQAMANPVFYQEYRQQLADCILEITKADPSDSSAAISGAIYLSRLGNTKEAEAILNNILKHYPGDTTIYMNLVSFLYGTQNWERLEVFADSTITLLPDLKPTLFMYKGLSQFHLKKYDDAIKTFLSEEKFLKKNKDTLSLLQIYSIVGDMFHSKKDNASCFKYYNKALKLNPKEAGVLNNYAWYLISNTPKEQLRKKDLDKALAMSRTAVEVSPGEASFLDTYAWILYLKGDFAQSKKYFLQAIGYGGDNNYGILERYADLLAKLKEKDLAVFYYKKALLKAIEEGELDATENIQNKMQRVQAEETQLNEQ